MPSRKQFPWYVLPAGAAFVAFVAVVAAAAVPRPARGHGPRPTPADPTKSGEKANFDRAYRLDPGRALKHVPPPRIQERLAVFRALVPGPAGTSDPDYIVFSGKPGEGVQTFGRAGPGDAGTIPLRRVLTGVLGMSPAELDGPDDLLALGLPGDWVIDPDAPLGAKLSDLSPIIRRAHGRLVRFERRGLEREAIVAGGRFELKSLPDVRDPSSPNPIVFLFTGLRDPARGGQTSGTPDEFFRALGRCAGHAIIDETRGPRPEELRWVPQISAHVARQNPGPDRQANLRALLENVSAQTGLTFELVRRKVAVWVAVEGPAAG